ncbi:MAG: tetratricopeptide repeat protein [Bradyrhizobium sp.]|jgi:adenylate cyclase|nr:MAG: tetratricopeptide repeat protein [Bradyrhizobium sp.]
MPGRQLNWRRARLIQPNSPAHVLTPSGYSEEAVVLSEKAISLSPNHPAVYLGTLGNAYRLSGRTEQAIAAFKSYHARSPGFGLTDMVIAYQQTGQVQEARRTAEQFIMVRPNFTIDAWLKTQFRRDTVGLRPIPLPCAPQRFR